MGTLLQDWRNPSVLGPLVRLDPWPIAKTCNGIEQEMSKVIGPFGNSETKRFRELATACLFFLLRLASSVTLFVKCLLLGGIMACTF